MKILLNSKRIFADKGMVLLVSLVMVALMSLIAVAAIRGSNLQEVMAGNLRDRNVAFQSGETALRMMEAKVADPLTAIGAAVAKNENGYFIDLNQSTTITRPVRWELDDWKTNGVQLSGVTGVSVQPFAVVEQLSYSGTALSSGGGVDFISQEHQSEYQFYRVTTRSVGLTENSEVILQSTYIR